MIIVKAPLSLFFLYIPDETQEHTSSFLIYKALPFENR